MKVLVLIFCLSRLVLAQNITNVADFFSYNNIETHEYNDTIVVDPYSFFPLAVGNHWQYSEAGGIIRNLIVRKDSVLNNNSKWFYFDEETRPKYLVDTNYNVFFDPIGQRGNKMLYKLNAVQHERWWIEKDSVNGEFVEGYIGEVDSIYNGTYLGKDVVFKVISNYLAYNNFGEIEEFWDSDRILASGIGLIYEGKDGIQPDILVSAIIDGDTLGTVVGVEKVLSEVPNQFSLSQNYPNPFNPTTNIKYSIPTSSYIVIDVFNTLGQKVQTLFEGIKNRGEYSIQFNGANLSSGTYFVQLVSDNYNQTIKLHLLK